QGQREPEFLQRALRAWDLLTMDTSAMGLLSESSTELRGRPLLARPWWKETALLAVEQADKHVDAGEFEEAIEALRPAVEAEPEDAVIRLYRAQLEVQVGDLGRALLDLVSATTVSPHYAPAQEQLAALHHQQGNLEGVRDALDQICHHHE
ncbi:MAG: tetratricopeptide repeat protein, partial [Acidimicrobiales bacterium]